jgi:hypothetical protein
MTSTDQDGGRLPEAGRDAAAGATTEGIEDAELELDEEGRGVLRRRERSGGGPAAGEEDIVSVETGVQREGDDDVTRHPTLRGDS